MENNIKKWIESKLVEINEMSETDMLKIVKEEFAPAGKFYKSQNEWFLQVEDTLIMQVRINRRYCPINEVPAQLLLKQTGADKVLVVIVNGGVVSYKTVELATE